MKRMLIFMMALCCAIASWTQDYKSLDAKQPIEFKGDRIVFSNQEIILGPKAFFIDGQLSDNIVKNNPYVFNSFNEAAEHFTAGTESEPMMVYIAPYVYWIDNPDDTEIKRGKNGREPFGVIVKCPYLH